MEAKKRLSQPSSEEPIEHKKKKIEAENAGEWLCNGAEVINMKQVLCFEELESESKSFRPTFTYQLLEKKDTVYGYKGLNISIFLTKATLYPYLRIEYKEKLKGAEDLIEYFDRLFQNSYTTSLEKFKKQTENDKTYMPSGRIIREFNRSPSEHYIIYKQQAKTMKEVSSNLQAVMMLFIDGLSFIDLDPYWNYYLLYQVSEDSQKSHTLVGYATTYESHQRVDKYRVRISQFFVLPTFQRKGFGGEILEAIYKDLQEDASCFEITVEDPSDEFLAMRDYFDTKMILQHGFFNCFKRLGINEKITKDNFGTFILDKDEITTIAAKLKLTRIEIERCFEMLKYAKLDHTDPEVLRMFRIAVKKRLFLMQKDSLCPNERLEKIIKGMIPRPVIIFEGAQGENSEEEDDAEEIVEITPEQRKAILEGLYIECSSWYQKLAGKMSLL